MSSSDNYYQLYIDKVLQLAATLVIKSQATANALNQYVTDYFGASAVDLLDPTTWKYYLNLAGEYHPSDSVMYVVSSDTLQTIEFSKENLLIHRATARAYQYGTRQYLQLVAQYPTQEMLIRGILYPVDLATAIAAEDFQILGGYPAGLVEDNEYSLLANLQAWINRFRARWTNDAFRNSDELYDATILGIMYLALVPAVLNLRLAACKTNEAHSFHVRQYLGSHGFLDAFVDIMTLKQRLFFYRNIAYIERHAGTRDTFAWLVEHIMTERNLPLAEFVMRHDVAPMPANLYPQLVFQKNSLNLSYTVQSGESLTLDQLLRREDPLARDNGMYRPDYEPRIQTKMENSLSNVVLTKMLDSSMIDDSNSAPHTLTEVLMNEWLNQAAAGSYTAFVTVTNPKTGETMPMTVKEAFAFVWYAFCTSIGIEIIAVPPMLASHVQRTPLPTVDEIWSITDHAVVDRTLAVQALSLQPVIAPVVSTDAFYELCVQIHEAIRMQRGLVAYQEHHGRRAMVMAMCERIYSDNVVHVADPDMSYDQWFAQRNFHVDTLTVADLSLMYVDLVQQATGMDLHNSTSVRELQQAMIKMLTQLSSYSIQITSEINPGDVKKTDWTAVRVGDINIKTSGVNKFPDAVVGAISSRMVMSSKTEFPITSPESHRLLDMSLRYKFSYDIPVEAELIVKHAMHMGFVQAASVKVRPATPPAANTEGIIPVMGYEAYLALDQTQRQTLKDLYTSPYLQYPDQAPASLTTAVTNTTLDGLEYIPPNALLDDAGLPIRDENGNIITG